MEPTKTELQLLQEIVDIQTSQAAFLSSCRDALLFIVVALLFLLLLSIARVVQGAISR